MVIVEYLHFLQTLVIDNVSNDVRKIANLVFKYMEELIPLSTTHGRRIKKIVELTQTNWSSICSDIQPLREQATKQACPITQITKLSVGPFRGFEKKEDFDLSSNLVLIYGPNGTGKSSFCEALEYGLLGTVTEAASKRFRNQDDYLKNARTNSFTQPILMGMVNNETDIAITADEALYRFCFIEKNRIDNFSRIAAQTPAKQTELISVLFGLEDFSEFVHNFTDSMDNYIDLVGVKSMELNGKQQAVAGFQQHLDNAPESFKKRDGEENALAEEFRNGCTFTQMVVELKGSEENKGLIAQLEAELEKPIRTKSNLTLSDLQGLKRSIESDIQGLKTKKLALEETSQEVSYKKLYEAIIQVKDSSTEKCPACQTPLSQAREDPFKHADIELEKLRYLGEQQEAISKLDKSICRSLNKLSQIINTCCSNVLNTIQTIDEENDNIDWWNSLFEQLNDESTAWQHIEAQVKKLENADKEIAQAIEKRANKNDELNRLREFASNIDILQSRRDTAINIVQNAEAELEKFNTENVSLIADVEAEKNIIAQNQTIANAYAIFIEKINDYNNGLPAQLIADLGETIVQLYNAFNRHDAEHEKLAMVQLPLQQNQCLKISFKNNPDCFFDALHILSEGHIRCVGLAILAAKNIKEKCPLLIFDDPVNAIDDDHRESIRRTMFEDMYFEDKQIILACHGEEFFKDIQNLLSVEQAETIRTVSFLPKSIDHHICVNHDCHSYNYVIAARSHLDKNEKRDALGKARKALESLAKGKVWRYVSKYGDGYLSIKLRSAKAQIELRNLTEQLKSKITEVNFYDKNKCAVLNPLESLLGINGDSREWRYLNKGTHEEADRSEFDRQTVNDIVTALELLDKALADVSR